MNLNKLLADRHEARRLRLRDKSLFLTTLLSDLEAIGKKEQREPKEKDLLKVCMEWRKGMLFNIKAMQEELADKFNSYSIGTSPKEAYTWAEQMRIVTIEDALEKYSTELSWLDTYLPKQLTEDEIDVIITELLDKDISTLGGIMKHFSTEYKGSYDGKQLSSWVRARI